MPSNPIDYRKANLFRMCVQNKLSTFALTALQINMDTLQINMGMPTQPKKWAEIKVI